MPDDGVNRRILIVDDNEKIHQDYRKVLGTDSASATALSESEAALFGDAAAIRWGFELDSAHQGQEGLAMVTRALAERRPYAMAFVDMRMPPGWDGIETIERLWQTDPQLQIALCTAYSDYSWEAIFARIGQDDRLLILKKPFDNVEIRQMASALTVKWQMTQEAAFKVDTLQKVVEQQTFDLEKMVHLAHYDILTDLPSGALLQDFLTQALAISRRHHGNVAVMFVGLDRFKQINTSLGHSVGDALLKSVALRLTAAVRRSDAVFRRGSDEFVLLFEYVVHPEQTLTIAEKILSALRQPHRIDGHDLSITPSIGVAVHPMDGQHADALLMKARTALQHAKQAGGDGYLFFKAEMNERALERQSMAGRLRRALDRGELALHYQPKIDLGSDVVSGVEALIRWWQPGMGFVSPAQFIPVAEDCGLIVPITRWVLHEACRQARSWLDAGLPPLPVAINISALDFRSKSLVGDVCSALSAGRLQPHCLELELTEGILIHDAEATNSMLRALKDIGVRLAIDDFGTGYSSLGYLRRFRVDTLKIDQSFVRDITEDDADARIVKAIIDMGKHLGLKVVAEGVETHQQLVFLRENRCDEGQGFYFSRAVEAEEFGRWLVDRAPKRPVRV